MQAATQEEAAMVKVVKAAGLRGTTVAVFLWVQTVGLSESQSVALQRGTHSTRMGWMERGPGCTLWVPEVVAWLVA